MIVCGATAADCRRVQTMWYFLRRKILKESSFVSNRGEAKVLNITRNVRPVLELSSVNLFKFKNSLTCDKIRKIFF